MGGNEAVEVNAPWSTQHLTTAGSSWLWFCFTFMAITNISVLAWSFTLPRGKRVFHQMANIALTVAAISYFTMASDLGNVPIEIEFSHANDFALGTTRAIFYVRYLNFFLTGPFLLLTLLMSTGLPLGDMVITVFFDLALVVCLLAGAVVHSDYKWAYWTFAVACESYVLYSVMGPARWAATKLGGSYRRTITISAFFLAFVWSLYPIAWGLADGGNVISTDSEMIFYGILDLLAIPVFLVLHLFLLSKEDLTALELTSGKFSVSAVDVENQLAMTQNGAATSVLSPAQKATLWSRRGRFDQAPVTVPGQTTQEAAPRASDSTAVGV